MQEIITFFQEIFMIKEEGSKIKIGLSQFKEEEKKPEKKVKKLVKKPEEIKLSDLMRRA
ncbi:MAG: hypothetical protein ACLSWI_02035 [Candidatus Gastranaerophilaceae bacterium]